MDKKDSAGCAQFCRHFCHRVCTRDGGELKTLELTRLQGGIRPTSLGHGVPWATTVAIVNCRQKRGLTGSPMGLSGLPQLEVSSE